MGWHPEVSREWYRVWRDIHTPAPRAFQNQEKNFTMVSFVHKKWRSDWSDTSCDFITEGVRAEEQAKKAEIRILYDDELA